MCFFPESNGVNGAKGGDIESIPTLKQRDENENTKCWLCYTHNDHIQ